MPEQGLPNKRANPKEQMPERAAVLRREAEQFRIELTNSNWWERADKIEAFARRQRAQALESAAKNWPPISAEAHEIVRWLRARAAAEGTD